MIWELIERASGFGVAAWTINGFFLYAMKAVTEGRGREFDPPRVMRAIWAELRPFYLPLCFIHTFFDRGTLFVVGNWWGMGAEALNYVGWFLYKDLIDDDRWKRRREKLASKVELRGAKLVVVPVKS